MPKTHTCVKHFVCNAVSAGRKQVNNPGPHVVKHWPTVREADEQKCEILHNTGPSVRLLCARDALEKHSVEDADQQKNPTRPCCVPFSQRV
ncbi:hypothetical protein NDU88_004266 [Pleurodeles waltl]|uniref:Uncharacterized protein n=1 Tax=Pleurodeles waltl TaxID=8319 RepID=A0AAV7MT52_PLEWA|nr:hypothetical protein NDU88_004266 [Pleurodeles waltl]